jgi:2-phosphoglycerate kinase
MVSIIPDDESATTAFDRNRLERSLLRRGLDRGIAHSVARYVEAFLENHVSNPIHVSRLVAGIGYGILNLALPNEASQPGPDARTPPSAAPIPT